MLTLATFSANNVALMVGGTGLYIQAFCEGFDDLPGIDPEIRKNISSSFMEYGFDWLYTEVKNKDPFYFLKGEIKNPQRMMRALEVIISSGKSILSFQEGAKKKRDFNIIKIGLELPRDQLNARIDQRVETMITSGLLEEVKVLLPFRTLNALQTV